MQFDIVADNSLAPLSFSDPIPNLQPNRDAPGSMELHQDRQDARRDHQDPQEGSSTNSAGLGQQTGLRGKKREAEKTAGATEEEGSKRRRQSSSSEQDEDRWEREIA